MQVTLTTMTFSSDADSDVRLSNEFEADIAGGVPAPSEDSLSERLGANDNLFF